MDDIVIIGAGECGTRAAFTLRSEGFDGRIRLIGAEAQLPYERPPLSKPGTAGAVCRLIADQAAFDEKRIELRIGATAVRLDPEHKWALFADGSKLSYDRLLLTTGASPRQLTCPGQEFVHTFRTFNDAEWLCHRVHARSHCVVIGAGLIGLELAASLVERGARVTVIESSARAMARAVPEQLAERISNAHVSRGVDFRFSMGVSAVSARDVTLSDGTVLEADAVVAAIGVAPSVELAEASGILTQNGVVVSDTLETSETDIFAAGDCANVDLGYACIRFESWESARLQGEAAARNMLGQNVPFVATPWFWSDQYDLNLQVAGFPERGETGIHRTIGSESEIIYHLDRTSRLVAVSGDLLPIESANLG